jgi:hypothetical protein
MGNVVLPHYSQIAPIQLAQKIALPVKVWILTGGKDNRADPSEHVPKLVESENRLLEVVDLLGSAKQNPNRGADDVIVSESICS